MESPSSVGGGGRNRILSQRQHQKHQQQHNQNSISTTPIINNNNNNNNTVEETTYTSNRFNNCSPSPFPHFPPPPDYPPPENKHNSTCAGSGRKVQRYPDDTDTIELCLEDEPANNTGSRSFNNSVGRRVGGEGGGQHNIDAQVIYFSFLIFFCFSRKKMFNQLKSI